MLFNSYLFVLLFLPLVLAVYFLLGRWRQRDMAIAWLVGASLFFYGWWNPAYLGLIVGSMLFNYAFGVALTRGRTRRSRTVLAIGVAGNLAVLGYFKYANFFVDNVNRLAGPVIELQQILLPLGISFFTFQQIAYLVDAYRQETHEYSFLHYCLFVTFFPQLIAGPIVHHREILPQFTRESVYRPHQSHLAVGITIFVIGLFKKVVIADTLAQFATPVFDAAARGTLLTWPEAWVGALAYTFQLYFDFSGYSDMAIGIARMFGIRLPVNFNSPYKATSVIDFWRRWHITLSRFLKDYLYIPLGGNRKGPARRYANLLITMVLGGLWHGAGWTYVAWGTLHGLLLVVNHAWHALTDALRLTFVRRTWWRLGPARVLTLVAVTVAWVFFRAADLGTAISMIRSMAGVHGLGTDGAFANHLVDRPENVMVALAVLIMFAWFAPNTQQIMARHRPTVEPVEEPAQRLRWRPNWAWTLIGVVLAMWSLLSMTRISEFLYFQF